MQLIRARPAISTDRLMPKHPSSTPPVVTTRGTRTYSLSVAVLATHGEQYHPRYSILSHSADGTWRYDPYGTSVTLLSTDAALGTLNPAPDHFFATMLVYRLCVPTTTAPTTRPSLRTGASKRRINHRSTDRNRAQRRVTAIAAANVPVPASPTPTSVPDPSAHARPAPSALAPLMPTSVPSPNGAVAHTSLRIMHSLLFEFLSISVYMPPPYTVATATACVRDSWGAFTIFVSRVLGATAMALPDERRLGQLASALRFGTPADDGASERLQTMPC